MTVFAHPAPGEPLDVTAVLRVALSALPPPRAPGDAVPVRAAHSRAWSHGPRTTASWCPDEAPETEIDWSDEAIEAYERAAADRERGRRGGRRG